MLCGRLLHTSTVHYVRVEPLVPYAKEFSVSHRDAVMPAVDALIPLQYFVQSGT